MLVIYTWSQCASFMTSRIKPVVQIKYKDGRKKVARREHFLQTDELRVGNFDND